MNYVALFFAGAFLCNCIPHLCAGLQGASFPTPFAKPRGIGDSSSFVNFLRGAFNVCIGLAIHSRRPIVVGPTLDCLAPAAGALVTRAYLSRHFGKVRRDRATPAS